MFLEKRWQIGGGTLWATGTRSIGWDSSITAGACKIYPLDKERILLSTQKKSKAMKENEFSKV